jgi:hypothetical protein
MSYAWCVHTYHLRKSEEGVCDDEDTSCTSTPAIITLPLRHDTDLLPHLTPAGTCIGPSSSRFTTAPTRPGVRVGFRATTSPRTLAASVASCMNPAPQRSPAGLRLLPIGASSHPPSLSAPTQHHAPDSSSSSSGSSSSSSSSSSSGSSNHRKHAQLPWHIQHATKFVQLRRVYQLL